MSINPDIKIDKFKMPINILGMSKKLDFVRISETLKAVAHPVRIQIVAGLINDECNVSMIQERLGLPQSTISQHLAILRRYGIVRARREGVKVCYHVSDPAVRELIEILTRE
jgi:ArsR family transcriptional regulator